MSEQALAIPNEAGWPKTALADACELIRRGTAPSYVEQSDVYAIGQRCVTGRGFDRSFARPHDDRRMSRTLEPRPGDILLNSTGTGTIGRSCSFSVTGNFIIDGHVTVLRPRDSVADGRWIEALVRSPWGQAHLESRCFSGSTNQVELSRTGLASMAIPTPSIWEQRRISDVLDKVDAAISTTQRLITKLELSGRGLLQDLLTRGVDKCGKLRDRVAQPEQFVDTAWGSLPETWDLRPLQGVADVSRGKFTHRPRNDPDYYGGEAPFIQTGDVAAANGAVITHASQSLSERGVAVSLEFPANTIAVTIAANIADTAILGRPMYFPDSVVGVQVDPVHSVRYVELCIRAAQPRLAARAPQSAQKNINLQDLRPLVIPVPGPAEQMTIAAIYEAHATDLASAIADRDKLSFLKVGLMHDLLTGRVRVKVDDEVPA